MSLELMESNGKPVFTPRWNYYRCVTCHGFFVTVEIHEGKTPEQMPCRASQSCKGPMTSGGHRDLALWPATAPKVARGEFFRPVWGMAMKKKYPAVADWLRHGGLVLRKATEFTPKFPGTEGSIE